MKQIHSLLRTVAFGLGALCLTVQGGTPQIQFDRMVYDFGNTARVDTVTGVFKFKNVGDDVLKVEPPKPSCGCTFAELSPDTLPPGESGELPFTLHLGMVKALIFKHIVVKSNDPKTPEVSLAIKADYTPLYYINPLTLAPKLAFGMTETTEFTTLTRTDGEPLRIAALSVSKPWISAAVEPPAGTDAAAARIRITIQREGIPRHFNEFIHVYAAGQTNAPVTSIYVFGQIMGEVSLSPEALYWSVTDPPQPTTERPEALVLRRVMIRSADGKAISVTNPQSTVPGIQVELVPKESGKVYELVARLEKLPPSTVSGHVSFETSVASQPRIQVPIIVNVFKR